MTATHDTGTEFPLSHYIMVLWRRKVTIIATMLVLALLGWLIGAGLEASYTSTAEVLAKPAPAASASTSSNQEPPVLGDELAFLMSDRVLGVAESEAGHDIAAVVTPQGAVTNIESNVVTITVTGEEGATKADAQLLAETYVEVRRADLLQASTTLSAELTSRIAALDTELAELSTRITDLDAQIAGLEEGTALRGLQSQRDDLIQQRDVLDERRSADQQQLADLELTTAVNPSLGVDVLTGASDEVQVQGATQTQYATAGLALGLILGVLLAFARDHFDRSVRTTRDVGPDIRVLGAVPRHTQGASA